MEKRRVVLYLLCWFVQTLLLWIVSELSGSGITLLWSFFSIIPVTSVIITRWITKDHSSWNLRFRFKENRKTYVFSTLLPTTLIFLGAVLFFVLYPNEIDPQGNALIERFDAYGGPTSVNVSVSGFVIAGIVLSLFSFLALPMHIFALGEELGWRGYLLKNMTGFLSKRNAILISGVLWGFAHAPLIFYGFNYGQSYWGFPFSGILMTVLVMSVLNVWLSYVYLKSGSIWPSAILHGSINLIGEVPALFALANVSVLLGPSPTGIIGISFLLVGALWILIRGFARKAA